MSSTRTSRFTRVAREEQTMTRLKLICTTLVALVVTGLGMASSPAAFADTTIPSCQGANTSVGTGNCADSFMSSSTQTTTDKSYQAVNNHGKILVRWNMKNGIKVRSSETKSKNCPLLKSASQRSPNATCIRLARGAHFVNSGVRVDCNCYAKWPDTVHSKWMRFVKRNGNWYKAGDNTGQGNCGNEVFFHSQPHMLKASQIILVRSFDNWVFAGHVAVHSAAIANALAQAWCNTSNSHATANGSGQGQAGGSASASFKVKGLSKVKALLKSNEASLTNQVKLQFDGQAMAQSKSSAVANAKAQVSCSSSTPPGNTAPSVSAAAKSCVQQGQATDITGFVSNPNSDAAPGTVTIGSQSVSLGTVAAGGSASFTLHGFGLGSYSGTATLGSPVNMSTTFTVSVQQCPQQTQSITITSYTQLNMIPAGSNSGPFYVTVNASDAGGQLTVDPGIGTVSDCSGGAQQGSMTFVSLPAGNSTLCVLIWAPNDASKPSTMTVTLTAILGSARDVKSETLGITYPTRT